MSNSNVMVTHKVRLNLYLLTRTINETSFAYSNIIPLFMQQAFIRVKTIRHCVSSAASPPAAVSDLNAVVCLLALTTQHVNITLSSVAPSYSRPPQTQAIMLFTLCQALPRTMTLFLLEVT